MTNSAPEPRPTDSRTAMALMKGLVTEAQVAEAEQMCAKLKSEGLTLSVFEVLVKKGLLSEEQAKGLENQRRVAILSKAIPGYELLEKIGQGGMGAVFKARQKTLDRIVAVKILPAALAQRHGYAERFMREARASACLNHPNIVSGIDVGKTDDHHYFVMEYVEGLSLQKLVERRGPMAEAEVLRIALKMAGALAAIANAGLVHRDLKPENIILANHGEPLLCDLGLAREVNEDVSLTQANAVVGTALYMAPEQAEGAKDLDIRADLYALGATLYFLLTGRPLFEGKTGAAVMLQQLNGVAQHPKNFAPGLSDGFCFVLRKLLAKNRADRYESPMTLGEDLDALIRNQPPTRALAATAFPSSLPPLGVPVGPFPGQKGGSPPLLDARTAAGAKPKVSRATTGRVPPITANVTKIKTTKGLGSVKLPRRSVAKRNYTALWTVSGASFLVVLSLILFFTTRTPNPRPPEPEKYPAPTEAPPPPLVTQLPPKETPETPRPQPPVVVEKPSVQSMPPPKEKSEPLPAPPLKTAAPRDPPIRETQKQFHYPFDKADDLRDWKQLEPGWTIRGGLTCERPAVNQRIEWRHTLSGTVKIVYEGVTQGDLGISFADEAAPERIFDRVVIGGPDGKKVGLLSPGKGAPKLIDCQIADGNSHQIAVRRSKESLSLSVNGKEVLSVPNDQTHNPKKYKLRLHLFDRPGTFTKLSIETEEGIAEVSPPVSQPRAIRLPNGFNENAQAREAANREFFMLLQKFKPKNVYEANRTPDLQTQKMLMAARREIWSMSKEGKTDEALEKLRKLRELNLPPHSLFLMEYDLVREREDELKKLIERMRAAVNTQSPAPKPIRPQTDVERAAPGAEDLF